jgi:hypothetical protein
MPQLRADLRAGSIVQAALNPHRKKSAAPIKLKDCILDYEPIVPMTGTQVMRYLKTLTASSGGTIKDGHS